MDEQVPVVHTQAAEPLIDAAKESADAEEPEVLELATFVAGTQVVISTDSDDIRCELEDSARGGEVWVEMSQSDLVPLIDEGTYTEIARIEGCYDQPPLGYEPQGKLYPGALFLGGYLCLSFALAGRRYYRLVFSEPVTCIVIREITRVLANKAAVIALPVDADVPQAENG